MIEESKPKPKGEEKKEKKDAEKGEKNSVDNEKKAMISTASSIATPTTELVKSDPPIEQLAPVKRGISKKKLQTLSDLAAKSDEEKIEEEISADQDYEDLSEMEQDILQVAKDSLKKKRHKAEISFDPYTPMVEKILNDSLAKFHAQKGYQKEDIIGTIKKLEKKQWIVTAERRTKEEILDSDLYQDIINFIRDYPGIHARDDKIQEKLEITRNPFLKHMLVLQRFGLVQKKRHGKLSNFYLSDFKEDDIIAELIVLLYNDIVRQLVILLLKNPSATLMELAENIIPPVYHGAIQYHLKKLKKIGFVSKEDGDRVVDTDMLKRYNSVVCNELKIPI